MKDIRIIFMGTPVFAQEVLKELIRNDLNIIATVSQPDRKVGRKQKIEETAVKFESLQAGIPCLQPHSIREDYQEILSLKPDLIITCAYGQIIPKEILDAPPLGCVNIHASLLPKLRGGAPIHKAIIYGYQETGITIMEMAEGMDTGDMIKQYPLSISVNETQGSLEKKLIELAKEAIMDSLPSIIKQDYSAIAQDDSEATYAYNVSKEEEFISFQRRYESVSNHIRGLIPVPVGYGLIEDFKLKIHQISHTDQVCNKESGEVIGVQDTSLMVCVDEKILLLDKIQPIGKKVMSGRDFMNGQGQNLVGKCFK